MKKCSCGLNTWPLNKTITMCPRCDTSAQHSGTRVGPPNAPGTRNGWFNATFGDRK